MIRRHPSTTRTDTLLPYTTLLRAVYADQARVAGAGIDPRMELESAGASLTVNWTLAPRLSLTSISAYEHFTRLHAEDTDGTSLVFLDRKSTRLNSSH